MAVITNTTIVCDRCKQEVLHSPWKKQMFNLHLLKAKVTKLNAEMPLYNSWDNETFDLCKRCAEELREWIYTRSEENNT